MMHAHTPPYTTKTAKQLYDEASDIAAAQDVKLDPGNDALPSILADFRAVVKRLEVYAERLRGKRSNGIPAESAYIASFGPSGPLLDDFLRGGWLREALTTEDMKGFGIGDVEPQHVAKTATTVATSRHPMAAEALRDHDERLNGPEDHL